MHVTLPFTNLMQPQLHGLIERLILLLTNHIFFALITTSLAFVAPQYQPDFTPTYIYVHPSTRSYYIHYHTRVPTYSPPTSTIFFPLFIFRCLFSTLHHKHYPLQFVFFLIIFPVWLLHIFPPFFDPSFTPQPPHSSRLSKIQLFFFKGTNPIGLTFSGVIIFYCLPSALKPMPLLGYFLHERRSLELVHVDVLEPPALKSILLHSCTQTLFQPIIIYQSSTWAF